MELKVNEKIYRGIKNVNEKWIHAISSESRGFLNWEGVLGLYW